MREIKIITSINNDKIFKKNSTWITLINALCTAGVKFLIFYNDKNIPDLFHPFNSKIKFLKIKKFSDILNRQNIKNEIEKFAPNFSYIREIKKIYPNCLTIAWKFDHILDGNFYNDLNKYDYIFVVGKYQLDFLKQKLNDKYKNKLFICLSKGIDINLLKPAVKFNNSKNEVTILHHARAFYKKGGFQLLEAMIDIIKTKPRVKLIISGVIEDKEGKKKGVDEKYNLHWFEKIVKTYQKNIIIKPLFNNYNYFDWYTKTGLLFNHADIFVLNTHGHEIKWPEQKWPEQWGWTLLEAASCGLPIIATKSGNIPYILKNKAILIDSWTKVGNKENIRQLKISLLRLIDNYSLRKIMGNDLRKMVLKNYSAEACAQKMINIFKIIKK